MRIRIHLSPGAFVVHPDPAVVPAGTAVEWRLAVAGVPQHASLSTEIYFDARPPFTSPFSRARFAAHGKSDADGGAAVTVDAGSANTPGDYKYGVRVEADDDLVIDVDPRLIVR